MAMVKKAAVINSRWGRPKEMLDTPRMVVPPKRVFTACNASKVAFAAVVSELMVMAKGSMIMSFFSMP